MAIYVANAFAIRAGVEPSVTSFRSLFKWELGSDTEWKYGETQLPTRSCIARH